MFDLTSAFTEGWAESQLGEGGFNASNNCIPTAFSNVMMALGYSDFEPQEWTNEEYGDRWSGYTNLQNAVGEMRKHFSDPPVTEIVNPFDNWDYVNAAGSQLQPCAVLFNSDSNASILGWGGFHCCVPIRCDGNTMVVLNSWYGTEESLTRVQYYRATLGSNAGSTVRFFRAVKGKGNDVTQAELMGMTIRGFWWNMFGENVPQEVYDAFQKAAAVKGAEKAFSDYLDDPNNKDLIRAGAARMSLNNKGGV